jgi:hypothetical protein
MEVYLDRDKQHGIKPIPRPVEEMERSWKGDLEEVSEIFILMNLSTNAW